MAGMMKRDDSGGNHVPLLTSREPKGPAVAGGEGSTGNEAFNDALILVVGAWVVLFVLVFTLRGHSV